MYNLLTGAAENVTGDAFTVPVTGTYILRYFGTFAGTTISLETRGDDGTNTEWITVPESSKVLAWAGRIYLEKNAFIRAVTSGGSGVSVSVTMNPAGRD